MTAPTETLEERIRQRAYHIWEASGRPPGRDVEFWHRACELVAASENATKPAPRRQTKSAAPRRAARTRQPAK